MNFLVHGTDNHHPGVLWESLFDVIIVGGCKPAFLTDDYLSLFRYPFSIININIIITIIIIIIIIIITRVHQSGALKNIEDKDALIASNLDKQSSSHIFQGIIIITIAITIIIIIIIIIIIKVVIGRTYIGCCLSVLVIRFCTLVITCMPIFCDQKEH